MQNNHHRRWNPFNAVINSNDVIAELESNRKAYIMPVFNEEQIQELDYKVNQAYLQQANVRIRFCDNYQLQTITGIINKLNFMHKTIKIKSKLIFFDKIVSIDEIRP